MIPQFKIRSSASGSIMSGNIALSDPQQKKLDTFAAKVESGKALTALQSEENDKLINLRDNPKATKGMMTYCQDWLKEQLYGRRKEIKSKYLDKGNEVEDASIEFLNSQLLTDYVKNEAYFENDFMCGTPDIDADIIIDMKNSYDFTTFPLFADRIENMDYYYQLQSYMELCDKDEAMLVYCLMDLPDHLIESEAKSKAYKLGGHWEDYYSECHKFHTYGDIDPSLKIKKFEIKRNRSVIKEIKERVAMCQAYINELMG